jgi:hypothetical protein
MIPDDDQAVAVDREIYRRGYKYLYSIAAR